MTTFVIATRNAHKVDEIRAVLGAGHRYLTLRDLPGAPTPEETGATFAANARLKAEAIAAWLRETRPEVLSAGPGVPVPAAGLDDARQAGAPAPPESASLVLADDSGLEVDALGGAPGVQSARFAAAEFNLPGNAPDAANNAKLLRQLADVPEARRTGRFRCAIALTRLAPDLPTVDFDGACEGAIGFVSRGAHGFGYDPLFTPSGFDRTFAELGEATKNSISHRARALEKVRTWLTNDSAAGVR